MYLNAALLGIGSHLLALLQNGLEVARPPEIAVPSEPSRGQCHGPQLLPSYAGTAPGRYIQEESDPDKQEVSRAG